MAKFDEADPRWLVEDKGVEGRNVNGWHWVETDALEWSKRRLAELFTDMQFAVGDGKQLSITGLDSVTGEAVINNRKQKIIPSYELEVKFNWEGTAAADGPAAQGKIHLPYLADENHDDDPEMRFVCTTDDATSAQLKAAFLQGSGKKAFYERIAQFVKELRAGGPAVSQNGTAAAREGQAGSNNNSQPKVKLSSAEPTQLKGSQQPSSKSAGKGRSIKLKEQFYCRPDDIFDALTHPGRFQACSQSPATIEAKVGGKFTWFGGSVQGVFTELEAGKCIAMDWRFNTWEHDCVSKVVIKFEEPEPGHTILILQQTQIPEADRFHNEDVVENTEKGWRIQIFQRMRQVFGWGVGL